MSKRIPLDFKIETSYGVTVGIDVTYFEEFQPATFHAPAEGGEVEFNILDDNGNDITKFIHPDEYEWLEEKVYDLIMEDDDV